LTIICLGTTEEQRRITLLISGMGFNRSQSTRRNVNILRSCWEGLL